MVKIEVPVLDCDNIKTVHGPRRILYLIAGSFFVGLAVLGVLLPGLPTTPFLLLASFFYMRSSPRLYRWLMRSRLFGGLLRDWHHRGGISTRTRVVAIVSIAVAVGMSIYFLPSSTMRFIVGSLALVGVVVVSRLPAARDEARTEKLEDALAEQALQDIEAGKDNVANAGGDGISSRFH